MQRRAAAVLIGLFLLAAVGAYALVATAAAPQITIADPAVELTAGDTATVGGQAYTLSAVDAAGATLESTEADARYTETWAADGEVTLGGQAYTVGVDGDRARLTAVVDEEAVLAADPAATGEVVTIGGERYVVRGDNVLVPAAAYFDPETVTVQEGSVVTYDGQARVVEQVDTDGVQLAWRAERTTETQLAPGEEVTLGAESYVVHIADGTRLQLVADRSVYAAQTAQIAAFERLVSGLWGVFIVSVLSVVFLAGFAFLPSRY